MLGWGSPQGDFDIIVLEPCQEGSSMPKAPLKVIFLSFALQREVKSFHGKTTL